jgi:trans-aconitate methyltransferase
VKKYIIIALCIINPLNAMELSTPQREPREWDAQAYHDGNDFQTTAFLHFIETNNIKIENRTILSAGCGTGKIESLLAEKTTHIHGFDASKNMIDFAKEKYGHIKNLSFEHCFAEDFQTQNLKQLALASFCLHWVADKKQAFQRIHDSLEINGEFFANVRTNDNLPIEIIIATEMMPFITKVVSFVTDKTVLELSGSSYPSHKEWNDMLQETGFEIIKSEKQFFNHAITADELTALQWPQISSRPIIKYIPDMFIQPLFKNYIDRYLAKLEKTDDNKFLDKYSAVIIHARKIKK